MIINVLLLVGVALIYLQYTTVFQDRIREENLINIANLNQSAAINASAMVSSWKAKLDDATQYIQKNELTYPQALQYLSDCNASDSVEFELVTSSFSGHLAKQDEKGGFPTVNYEDNSYYNMQQIFSSAEDSPSSIVRFTPEFTDSATAKKFFAIYSHLLLPAQDGQAQPCTLLLAGASRDMLESFNNQDVFEGLSSVMIDSSGNYIVSSPDFKSDNFYKYLYVYNNLSLDQRDAIRSAVQRDGSGELYYRNGQDQDCVFRYIKMTTNDWYCITSVPLSSFRTPRTSFQYAVYAVVALLVLLIIDVLWLRDLNRRLLESVRREKEAGDAKTEFLSRMSHDIRTPLNGIIGLASLASSEQNEVQVRDYLDKIKTSSDFLLGLVNDILDMSKVESGKMELHLEPYQGAEFCKYIEAVIVPLCQSKGQTLIVNPPEDTRPVMLDRLRFNQIFFNLLSNSVKYTQEGGTVELSWTKEALSEQRVAFDFIVRDNGVGMSEAFQKRMFEAFSQEHAGGIIPGSGLGLSIVWNLVSLMGGQINVQSKEGVGTTIFVHLEADISRALPSEPVPSFDRSLEGKHVLLCEDNEINAMITQHMVAGWGMTHELAVNGKLGVSLFDSNAPWHFDAILMDIQMPVMNGLDATRAIRALNREDAPIVPILAMTANAYDADVQKCKDAGMNAHMGKPIQPDLLHQTLIDQIKAAEQKRNGIE